MLIRLLLAVLFLAMFAAPVPVQAQLLGEPASPEALTPEEAKALAELLRDEQSLNKLREKMDSIAAQAAEAPPPPSPTLARHLADITRDAADSASGFVSGLVAELQGLGQWEQRQDIEFEVGLTIVAELVGVIAATIIVFLLLRILARRATDRLAAIGQRHGVLVSTGLLLLCLAIDIANVGAAWAIGYLIAIMVVDSGSAMGIEQSLYLNAFLVVGVIRMVFDALFSPRHPSLRIPPMSDLNAAYWYHWLSRIVSVLGYGFMFIVPLVNAHFGFAVGRSLQVLVALTGLAMAVLIILQSRKMLQEKLRQRSAKATDFFGHFAAFLARYWHIAALVYVFALFVIWLSRPEGALGFILIATGKSAVAILLGLVATAAMSRAIAGGLHLPDDVRERLPLLEGRLNAFVPKVLRVVRFVVFLFVAAAVLESWETLSFSAWLASEFGQAVAASIISALLILLFGWLAWLGMSSWVEYRLNPNVGEVPGAREKTLLQLMRNAATVLIAALAIMLALSELGVNIGPLLAGAGVLGLAIGFGAQKMVQDVITGIFIQFENAINEGDVVTVGGTTGVVEKLTIRSVALRDLSGTYHIMPFSTVDKVSNFNRDFGFHVAAIGVAYRENIAEVKEAMQEAFDLLMQTDHAANIIGELEMHGLTEFGDSAIVIRARIRTLPGNQWAIGRAYNEFIKSVFDRRGIEIPFPHQTIYWGEDKAGRAPPLRITTQEPGGPPGQADAPPSAAPVEAPSVEPPLVEFPASERGDQDADSAAARQDDGQPPADGGEPRKPGT